MASTRASGTNTVKYGGMRDNVRHMRSYVAVCCSVLQHLAFTHSLVQAFIHSCVHGIATHINIRIHGIRDRICLCTATPHPCTHAQIQTDTHLETYTHTIDRHTPIDIHTNNTDVDMHTDTHTHTDTYTHTHTHTNTHTHTYIHTHTHTCIHTHTHTYTRSTHVENVNEPCLTCK